MNVFLYARKSTDEDDRQMLSIEAQLTELREYAKKEALSIAREFVEAMTAKTPGRPIFNELMAEVERGKTDGILAWHPDRLARNSVDGGRIIYAVDTGKLKALKFPTFWFENTPQGKFMLNIAFGQSKYYVDNLTENIQRGIRQKLRRGEYPDKPPVGYLNEPRLRTIVIDEATAPTVRRMFEAYATGKYTMRQLQELVTGWGLRTCFGNPIALSWFPKLLANPFYIGQFRFTGELYDGSHPPLISRDLFDRVQGTLARRSRGPYCKKQKPAFPLRGYFVCGQCGASITAERQKGHNYYRCTKRKGSCSLKYVREESLTGQLAAHTVRAGLGGWLDKWQGRVDGLKQTETLNADAILAGQKAKLAEAQTRLDRLLDVFLDGHVSRDEYTARKERMLLDKSRLAEEVAGLKQRTANRFELLERLISHAKRAEDAALSGDVPAMLDFHRLIGSNLRLFNATEEDERQTRALPEVPERKSVNEGRRGGFATRADTTPPRHVGAARDHEPRPEESECGEQTGETSASDAGSVSDEASGRLPNLPPSGLCLRRIGRPSTGPGVAAASSGNRRPSPLRGRIRRGFPVLRVEWPGPWQLIAEKTPTSKWWWGLDSNQRNQEVADLQSAAFNHFATPPARTMGNCSRNVVR